MPFWAFFGPSSANFEFFLTIFNKFNHFFGGHICHFLLSLMTSLSSLSMSKWALCSSSAEQGATSGGFLAVKCMNQQPASLPNVKQKPVCERGGGQYCSWAGFGGDAGREGCIAIKRQKLFGVEPEMAAQQPTPQIVSHRREGFVV